MLSVLVETREGEEERLAHTLASLVSAAVSGVVREVIVLSAEKVGGVAEVAEHAGCRVADSLSAAVGSAKGDWLLLLEAGAQPSEGWAESARLHAAAASAPAHFMLDRSAPLSLLNRLRLRRRPFSRGLLIRRSEAMGFAEGKLRLQKPVTLKGRIAPAS